MKEKPPWWYRKIYVFSTKVGRETGFAGKLVSGYPC